jgi:hypothetical protein
LFTPSGNQTRALIENNSTNITTFVRILKDPVTENKQQNEIVGKTKDSFIFSFKDENNFKVPILSHVKNMNQALFYRDNYGPAFCSDLLLGVKENDDSKEYNIGHCIQLSYDKTIRDTEDKFLVEDYEVFQIIKKEA